MSEFTVDAPITGHCNCSGITVNIDAGQSVVCSVCHCRNCRRAGAGASINYIVGEDDVSIQDASTMLKTYRDNDTESGNEIQRNFCGICGSPVYSTSPMVPGKKVLKATLFDQIHEPSFELYTSRREPWQDQVKGARQFPSGS